MSAVCAVWVCLLMGSDCGGYYPDFRGRWPLDAGRTRDATLDAAPDAPARTDATLDAGDVAADTADAADTAAAPPDARRLGGGWDVYTVAHVSPHPYGHGGDPRLVIDASGGFHLVHTSAESGEVYYSHGVPGAFETELVGRQASTDFVRPAAISVGGDVVHLAYVVGGEGGVTHRWRTGVGPWESEALFFEDGPPAAAHPAIALLPSGAPLFVGIGATTGEGVLAVTEVRALGLGAPEVVTRTARWVDAVDVAIAADGDVIAIFPATDIRYWTFATRYDDGTWSTARFRANLASLAAAPDGTLGVACVRRALTGGTVVWAVFAGGGDPGLEDVLPLSSQEVQRIDAAIGSDGVVHLVAERTDAAGTLTYVTNASGTWAAETVDRAWASRPAVALDTDDRPWIAYRDWMNRIVVATPAR